MDERLEIAKSLLFSKLKLHVHIETQETLTIGAYFENLEYILKWLDQGGYKVTEIKNAYHDLTKVPYSECYYHVHAVKEMNSKDMTVHLDKRNYDT